MGYDPITGISTGGKAPRRWNTLLYKSLSTGETRGGELQIEFKTGVYTTHNLVWLSSALAFSAVLESVKPAAQNTNVLQHIVIPISASKLCGIVTKLIGELPGNETLHARFYGLENSISAISTNMDRTTSFKVNVYPTSHKDDELTWLKMINIIAETLYVETMSGDECAEDLFERPCKFSDLLCHKLDEYMRMKSEETGPGKDETGQRAKRQQLMEEKETDQNSKRQRLMGLGADPTETSPVIIEPTSDDEVPVSQV